MNESSLKHLLRKLKALTLSSERKARMRADLSAYADLHALPETAPRAVPSPFSIFSLRAKNLYAGALVAMLFVAGGTQASLAAEGALPGDILYPIKVAVNEPLALSLSLTPERKAELSAKFATRRLDEAATLSSRGELDAAEADELASRFDAHVETLAKETVELESKGALATSLAVRTDLEQRLTTQAEDFTMRKVRADDTHAVGDAPEDRFAARVYEKSRTLATTREKLETALDLDVKAEEGAVAIDVRDLGRSRGKKGADELFMATVAAELGATVTVTATSTPTTTEERQEEREEPTGFPAQRFFAPFLR